MALSTVVGDSDVVCRLEIKKNIYNLYVLDSHSGSSFTVRNPCEVSRKVFESIYGNRKLKGRNVRIEVSHLDGGSLGNATTQQELLGILSTIKKEEKY